MLLFLFARILPRFSSIQQDYLGFVNYMPSFAATMEMEEKCREAAEPVPPQREPVHFTESIQLENVDFAYEEVPVIREVDLAIASGRTTAVVGPSGAGKSTIADLVTGLLRPTRGRVLIDDDPLTPARIASWRDQIGYVPQDTFLFYDTIRANLAWARLDATEEDIWTALRLASADEFVSRLSQGLDTMVGDRGVRLSGGERQRLALARALLRKPSLLILDEATSSLDSENERRILEAVDELHGSVTTLLISHRLSSVRDADVIYVLDSGRLVEFGTWQELIEQPGGRFRALCQAQGIEPAAPSQHR
jgi:ATP-binding cassette subfamily C protein